MRKSLFLSGLIIGLVALATVAVLISVAGAQGPPVPGGRGVSEAVLQDLLGRAAKVKKLHSDRLFSHADVVGTAVGLTEDGRPAIKVYTRKAGAVGIPRDLEGIPVEVEETGEFLALKLEGHAADPAARAGAAAIDPKSRFPRPVPIGVSTGNEGECSAGTIGARVKDGSGNVYALSNNHVYALENAAPPGSLVLQPGLYDTLCFFSSKDVIGTLSGFVPIDFSKGANNTVDAAIARSDTANLGNSTPANGYGKPKSATAVATLGLPVQKYGRTTSLTKGTITGINATILVGYSSGTARFVNQIVVGAQKGAFIKAGDSGSLLVTNPGNNPVGLLFAGSGSGKTAIANDIGLVLKSFNVTIDDR